MKTADAIRLAGGHVKDLAELLEITSSAISQWGEEVPQNRVWQLRVLCPLWFSAPTAGSVAAIERRSPSEGVATSLEAGQ